MLFGLRSSESWQKLFLLASICCNVALASYIAVQWLRPEQPLVMAVTPPAIVERIARRLPKSDAEILWGVYHSKEKELSAAQADYLHTLVKPIDLLAAPDFDVNTFRNAILESRDKRMELSNLLIETIVEAVGQMSSEGRRKLVDGVRPH